MRKRKPVRCGLVATAMLASLPSACAPAPTEQASAIAAFDSVGMFGVWSPDCRLPASRDNPRVTYGVVRQSIVHTVSFEPGSVAITDEVGWAHRLGDGALAFSVVRSGQTFATVSVRVDQGHLRILRSIGPGDRINVDNGIDTQTGKPALVDERCSQAVSRSELPG